ncbi:MAG: hypothetical protein ACJ72D_01450 [Marmoricola sp.]
MHLRTRHQRAAVAATTFLAHACATTTLVLLPAHLVLDQGLGPLAYAVLVGLAAAVHLLTTPVGRYLTSRSPGRLGIVRPGSSAASLATAVAAFSTDFVPIACALVLGVAALAGSRPAWRSLAEASAATDTARRGARSGCFVGLASALAASTLPDGLGLGLRLGAGVGGLALVVLVTSVEDRRAPLAPRRSVTPAHWRRALEVAEVRTAATLGAVTSTVLAGATIAWVAGVGTGSDSTRAACAVALSWLCYGAVRHVLGERAGGAVTDGLRQSARDVVEAALLVGVVAAASVAGVSVRVLG